MKQHENTFILGINETWEYMKQHENTFILGINETTWEYFYIRYKWNNMRILLY